MGINVGWQAVNSGLPSFDVTGPCTVTSGGRVVGRVGDGERVLFSDPLATPGANAYSDGGQTVTVARAVGKRWGALFTDDQGRGVTGLIYENDGDKISWKSDVSQFNARVARWPIEPQPRAGNGTLFLSDPSREADVWRIAQRSSHVILAPAATVPGVGLRTVVVGNVARSRIGTAGQLRFEIAWTEFEPATSMAPVVTWGEYVAASDGWTDESYIDLCRRIGGMP